MDVIAIIQARGRGTTLPRKNMYALNGRPLIEHFLTEMKRASCIDHICVWTEDSEIAEISQQCGAIALDRPKTMVHYGAGFHSPKEWDSYVSSQIIDRFGDVGVMRVHLNCNYVLFSAASVDAMYDKLLEDPAAHGIYPVYEVQPHLYMENPATGGLFPVWEQVGLDRQLYPKLYRRVGISIHHALRQQTKLPPRDIWLRVPSHEGLDLEREEDVPFAEYMLERRERGVDS